ncbi:hypothetical protein ACVWW4_003835 [Bradyrhizobium sp. LB7.1]
MTFVNTSGPMSAMDYGFPDVCNTPCGPTVVSVPYPNIAINTTAIPTQSRCLIMCMPAHNMATERATSTGDNAGVALGVRSGLVMGPGRAKAGSDNLFIGGSPATKMGDADEAERCKPERVRVFDITLSDPLNGAALGGDRFIRLGGLLCQMLSRDWSFQTRRSHR